jgi:hypothetical protein
MDKKSLICFLVVLVASVIVTISLMLPAKLNDQSQQGIDNIKQLQQQVEVYEE